MSGALIMGIPFCIAGYSLSLNNEYTLQLSLQVLLFLILGLGFLGVVLVGYYLLKYYHYRFVQKVLL